MIPRDRLASCPACGGSLVPITDCDSCGAAFEREDLKGIPRQAPCPNCGSETGVELYCVRCENVHSLHDGARPTCPGCGGSLSAAGALCPRCLPTPTSEATPRPPRPNRRVLGDYSEESVEELARALGIRRVQAEALCAAGLDSLRKVQRASREQFSAIRGISDKTARKIESAARRAMPLLVRPTPPMDLGAEYSCPVCACPASVAVQACLDCGLPFVPEDAEDSQAPELTRLEAAGPSDFLRQRLLLAPQDALLWYAHALALRAEERPAEALASAEEALRRDPKLQRAHLFRSGLLAGTGAVGPAAESLRSVLESYRRAVAEQEGRIEEELQEEEALQSLEELEERACPECSNEVLASSVFCPACGSPLLDLGPRRGPVPDPLAPLAELAETAEVPGDAPTARQAPPVPESRRGLVEGRGLVNGKGRINGLLDHRGFINGSTLAGHHLPAHNFLVRYAAVGVLLLTFFFAVNFVFVPREASTGFAVDGSFADWSARGLARFTVAEESSNPALNLRGYAVHAEGSELLLWIEVEGALFSDSEGVDTVHAFIDADGDPTTGYAYEGVGADYRVSVAGANSTILTAGAYEFRSTDPEDWGGWTGSPAPSVGLSRHALEVELSAGGAVAPEDDLLARFLVDGNDGEFSSSSVAVGRSSSVVEAILRPSANVVAIGSVIGTLEVALHGPGPAALDDILLAVDGPVGVAATGLPALLTSDSPQLQLPLVVTSMAGAQPGDAVKVRVTSVAATVPVTLRGGDLAAYAFSVGTVKRIDGLFADWANDSTPFAGGALANPNVDLVEHGVAVQGSAFVYARAAGAMLDGATLPQRDAPPRPRGDGGGEPVGAPGPTGPRARRTAEDRLVATLGPESGGVWTPLYRVEILGREGRVTRTAALVWSGGDWAAAALPVEAAVAGSAIEFSLAVDLGPSAAVRLDLRDWRGEGDSTQVFATRGTRGDGGTRPLASGPPAWPGSWTSLATDPDEALADATIEILEVQFSNAAEYLYVRVLVEGSSPALGDNAWWLYLDLTGDGDNDWLIEEKSTGICSYQWDGTNSDWGTGAGCDVSDTVTDSDTGSAVRTVSSCSGSNGCVDFALEKSDYAGLGSNPKVTAATDATEDLNLLGDTTRNPTDTTSAGCDGGPPDDCTTPLAIPEFGDLAPLLAAVAGLAVALRRRTARKA